jgi:hypothetical protein
MVEEKVDLVLVCQVPRPLGASLLSVRKPEVNINIATNT